MKYVQKLGSHKHRLNSCLVERMTNYQTPNIFHLEMAAAKKEV